MNVLEGGVLEVVEGNKRILYPSAGWWRVEQPSYDPPQPSDAGLTKVGV